MDKNTITGLILIFVIFLGFSFYTSSKQKKAQQEKAKIEALNAVEEYAVSGEQYEVSGERYAVSDEQTENTADRVPQTANRIPQTANRIPQTADLFYVPTTESPTTEYVVETDKAIYHFSKFGGYLSYAYLKNIYCYAPKDEEKKPLVLFDGHNSLMNIDLMLQNQAIIRTMDCYFVSEPYDTLIVDENHHSLSLKLYPIKEGEIDKDAYIEYLYSFKNDDYNFGFRINYVNMQTYLYPTTNVFTLQWDAALKNVERNYENEKNNTTIYYMDNLNKVEDINPMKFEKKDFTSQLKWVSFKQQYFTTVLIADSGYFSSGLLKTDLKEANPTLKNLTADLEFDIKNLYNGSFDMSIYIGPNQYKLLRTYDVNLERQVAIGWGFFLLHWINRAAVIPVFDWLSKYALNFGIIILVLTILLKIVLLPIAHKTYISSARMRVLKPEIEEISAKYPKPEDAMKKQQATMALYKSAGVSPMAGCLPAIIQMPILFAMFRFFPSAYELRQQSFLWADDLSTYDSVWNFGFNIPFYGDHVSLFCLLMTVATLIYTWLNNKMMTMGNQDQMKMMRIFMYIMPIMFLGIFNNFASGLTYYYLLVNLITFFQMWIFKMGIDEKKIRARLQANMAKPKQKSKWQMRMEAMVKQQQTQQKRKK